MPTTTELSPDEVDQLRQDATLKELNEQGGIAPLEDDPFHPGHLEALSDEERAELALAHDFRDARKLNYVVNRGDLTSAQVSGADPKETQTMIDQHFESKFALPMMRPDQREQVQNKLEGHYAEDALVKIFNEVDLGVPVHAELGSDYLDHVGKSDIILFIGVGKGKEILLKIQAKAVAKKEDVERLPANALLVELKNIRIPGSAENYTNEDVIALANGGSLADKTEFAKQYYKLVTAAFINTPRNVYVEAKRNLGM